MNQHVMLKFSTKFPYLDQTEKGSTLINKVDIALPENKRIVGYLVKFRLKLIETTSNFTSMSEQKVFVYYSNIVVYESECFPIHLLIGPTW